jgi:hypothetical protein
MLVTNTEVGLIAPFKYDNSIDWNPAAGTPAASGANFASSKLAASFFTPTNFRGAASVGDTWWKTWTRFF